jgi:glycosyltransferase involved in cell wall biosynthesis
VLVEACARLGDVTVALIGTGEPLRADPGRARLLELGAVDDAEKAAWLEAADVLSLPSAHESFGLAVAEAWSFGVPAVTSDIAPLRALVETVGGGLAVPRTAADQAEAIGALLSHPTRARAMGQAGLEYWHGHLSPEATAARTLDVYDELVGTRKAVAA